MKQEVKEARKMKTSKFGTSTTEGWIPHKGTVRGFVMPVKLDIVNPLHDVHPPMRDAQGKLVYALPNGGESL